MISWNLKIPLVAKRPTSLSFRKVEDIADATFVGLDENTIVATAAKALYNQEGCSIIVTRKDPGSGQRIPVGIVTERDLIFRVVAQNKGPFKVTLSKVMSAPIITIDSNKSVTEAMAIMKEKKINRLPVVGKTGALIGLVTTEMIMHKSSLTGLDKSEA